MKIENITIHGLEEAIKACRLPFKTVIPDTTTAKLEADDLRADKLAHAPMGMGHDNFLCGVVVQCTITAPRYWWPEFQRYHFADIISSTSTMHTLERVTKTTREEFNQFFSPETPEQIITAFYDLAAAMRQENGIYWNYDVVKSALPEGFLQKARITTNYRQLKTIYAQRHNHRLNEWREFCKQLEQLPQSHWIKGDLRDGTA